MLLNANNNATTTSSRVLPQPQRRSQILVPLGPSDEPPVFNLALNQTEANRSFLLGIEEWLEQRPNNNQLMNRLVTCCKSNLAMVTPNPETLSLAPMQDQAAWFEDIFAMIFPLEDCESSTLALACIRRRMGSNKRYARAVTLLAHIEEMVHAMLASHEVTRDALSQSCKAYVIVACLAAVLSPPRQRVMDGVRQSLPPSTQPLLPSFQHQSQGFGASVIVKKGNTVTTLDPLELYQETSSRWDAAKVEFEHTAVFYGEKARPFSIHRHASGVEPQLQPTRPVSIKREHSISRVIFEDDDPSDRGASEKPLPDKQESDLRTRTQVEAKARQPDPPSRPSTQDDKPKKQNLLVRVPTEETIDYPEEVDTQPPNEFGFQKPDNHRSAMLSISLKPPDGEERGETIKARRSVVAAFRLRDGVPVQVSITGGTDSRRRWAMEELRKSLEDEEASAFMTGKLAQKTLTGLDAEAVYMDITGFKSDNQNDKDNSSSTSVNRSYLLSMSLSGCDEETDDCDPGSSGANLSKSEMVGAFKLKDGSPVKFRLTGGSVMKRQLAFHEMQRHLLNDEAGTFVNSKKVKEFFDNVETTLVSTGPPDDVDSRGTTGDQEGRSETIWSGQTQLQVEEEEERLVAADEGTVGSFKISQGAPPQLTRLVKRRNKRWRMMWEMQNRYIREEAITFLQGRNYTSANSTTDEDDDKSCTLEQGQSERRNTESIRFKIKNGITPQLTEIHQKESRKISGKDLWDMQRRLLHEEASTFLEQKHHNKGDLEEASATDTVTQSGPSACLTARIPSTSEESGPSRLIVTAEAQDDGTLVAQILTEVSFKRPFSDTSESIQVVLNLIAPKELSPDMI
ncbi:unnamed protein product [Mesocestoides corti]|uniref:Uncharacterized protein n=2 Tax=Mesocestoides corti TaxID=53468 RepID=A0A0R3UHT5_MESCO|nr:unnamed protein product [Mesocestoides corti]